MSFHTFSGLRRTAVITTTALAALITAVAATPTASRASDSDGTARALGAGGLTVGVIGLATAGFAPCRKITLSA